MMECIDRTIMLDWIGRDAVGTISGGAGGLDATEAKSSIGRMPEKTARQEKRVQKSGLRGGFQKAQ